MTQKISCPILDDFLIIFYRINFNSSMDEQKSEKHLPNRYKSPKGFCVGGLLCRIRFFTLDLCTFLVKNKIYLKLS